MTPLQFITWLKGFTAAANSYNITPAQWDQIKEQLSKVHTATPQWQSNTTSGPVEVHYTLDDTKHLLHD